MSRNAAIYSLWKNPAFTERQRRTLWIVTQAVVFGLVLGLASRLVWDHRIVASIALALRDFGVVLWAMLRDSADACWGFLQAAVR